ATTRCAGASARPTTRAINASRLGSFVMSSTCAGPMTTPSTAPPLISGFLRVLTCLEISLASSATPSPPQPATHRPATSRPPPSRSQRPARLRQQSLHPHQGKAPPGQRILQGPDLDRLLPQVAAQLVLGDRVQPLQVDDQHRPAPVQVRPELIHHQFFYIFT